MQQTIRLLKTELESRIEARDKLTKENMEQHTRIATNSGNISTLNEIIAELEEAISKLGG